MIVVVVIVEHKGEQATLISGSASFNSILPSRGVVLFESVFEWEKITPRLLLLPTLLEFNN
jgi:hypothetical protein